MTKGVTMKNITFATLDWDELVEVLANLGDEELRKDFCKTLSAKAGRQITHLTYPCMYDGINDPYAVAYAICIGRNRLAITYRY